MEVESALSENRSIAFCLRLKKLIESALLPEQKIGSRQNQVSATVKDHQLITDALVFSHYFKPVTINFTDWFGLVLLSIRVLKRVIIASILALVL